MLMSLMALHIIFNAVINTDCIVPSFSRKLLHNWVSTVHATGVIILCMANVPAYIIVWSVSYYSWDLQNYNIWHERTFIGHHFLTVLLISQLLTHPEGYLIQLGFLICEVSNLPMYYILNRKLQHIDISIWWIYLELCGFLILRPIGAVYILSYARHVDVVGSTLILAILSVQWGCAIAVKHT